MWGHATAIARNSSGGASGDATCGETLGESETGGGAQDLCAGQPSSQHLHHPYVSHFFNVSESYTTDSASEKGGPKGSPIPQGVRRRSSLNPKP